MPCSYTSWLCVSITYHSMLWRYCVRQWHSLCPVPTLRGYVWVSLITLCYEDTVLGSGTAYAQFLHIVGVCEYDLTLYICYTGNMLGSGTAYPIPTHILPNSFTSWVYVSDLSLCGIKVIVLGSGTAYAQFLHIVGMCVWINTLWYNGNVLGSGTAFSVPTHRGYVCMN